MKSTITLGTEYPCSCRSGLQYGECHKPIFDASEEEMIAVAWRLYAEAWAENAAHYQSQGMYGLLADQLVGEGGISRVLDIGCGRGHGLLALRNALQTGAKIVGLDENPECLEAAADRLRVEPLTQNVRRIQNEILSNGYLMPIPGTHPLADQGVITLVQSDVIIRDNSFEQLLNELGPFDAVTLWFNGIHKARSVTELARHFEIKNDADHRALVEDRALTVAAERLRPGGVLHLVNRVATSDIEAICHEMAQTYSAWLGRDPFVLETLTAIPYQEPANGVRVRSGDANVNTMPGYAVSMLFQRTL